LNAFTAFGLNTEVPPGSLRYEQYRMYATGQAVVYRGGSGAQVPAMGLGQATFSAPVVHLVAKADIDWLSELRANMTGLDLQGRMMRAAQRAIAEWENRAAFEGSVEHGLFGLLNHPYMDTALYRALHQRQRRR